MEIDLNLELDFAKLSLTGNRYEEAQGKYTEILRIAPNNSVAWLGLGFSKYGLLLEGGSTLEEVFYCFEKARNAEEEVKLQITIEEAVINKSVEIIKSLLLECKELLQLNKEAEARMSTNLALGIVSAIAGGIHSASNNRSSSLYGNITALGGTAISYTGYKNAKIQQLTSAEQANSIKILIKSIADRLENYISERVGELQSIKDLIENLKSIYEPPKVIHTVQDEQPTYYDYDSIEDEKWYNKQWNVIFWLVMFFPAGLYGLSKSKYKGGILIKAVLIIAGFIILGLLLEDKK